MPDPSRRRRALRRIQGAAWLLLWLAVLHLLTHPWRSLGGLVSERLRWLEWVLVPVGIALGVTAGGSGRDEMEARGRTHAEHARLLLYPPLVATAAASIALTAAGDPDTPGVLVTALASYWLGLDCAFGIRPLLRGEPYSFQKPFDREDLRRSAAVGSAHESAQKARKRRI